MRELDQTCLDAFPEMLDIFDLKTLEKASNIGSYIFFEDYFNAFIENHKNNEQVLQKAADFIEYLAQSDDQDILNLTEIGILEGLVNRQIHEIAKFFKEHTKTLLEQATSRTHIDEVLWQINPTNS